MKTLLKLLCAAILIVLIVGTVQATRTIGLFEAWPDYAANPWAMMTLYDAYAGFLLFMVWVAYKERKVWIRVLWFILILGLGNMATAAYLLIELYRLRPDEGVATLLQRRGA